MTKIEKKWECVDCAFYLYFVLERGFCNVYVISRIFLLQVLTFKTIGVT